MENPSSSTLNRFPLVSPMKNHIFRDQASHTDCYHGASSLFSLCKEISNFLLTEAGIEPDILTKCVRGSPIAQSRVSPKESMEDALGRMCLNAGLDEFCESQMDYVPVNPPPKQFLLMVILQFFEQVDYATDIFNQSSFMRHVERIYSQQFSPCDEVWAICFNAIILLVWGSENSSQAGGPFVRSQLVQPSLLAVRSALGNSRVLMVPKLVNVQALAILVSSYPFLLDMFPWSRPLMRWYGQSIAAQHHFSPGLASSMFAQACTLAKIVGLHQSRVIREASCPEEAEERFKVIRSLYIRDKSFLLSRGSVCWLPTFDCTLDPAVIQRSATESSYSVRIQLAALQEEVYRLFHSAESYKKPNAERGAELARLDKQMSKWAEAHGIFASVLPVRDADLKLQFFSTRINAFRQSLEDNHMCQVLNDARASCLLLLMACGKFDQSMVTRYKALPLSRDQSNLSDLATDIQKNKLENSKKEAFVDLDNASQKAFSANHHSLLESFSPSAFCALVKNALVAVSGVHSAQEEEDISLLEGVCACYQELDTRYQGESYVQKVGRIFCDLLEITRLIRAHQQTQTPTAGTKAARETSLLTGSPTVFGRMQAPPDLLDLSRSSSYLTPSISHHDGFPAKILNMRTPETATTSSSPPFLTSLDSEFISQWYDPLRPLPFSPLLQQPNSAPGRKRPRFCEPDFVLDDADPTLLSDFLNTAPNVPF